MCHACHMTEFFVYLQISNLHEMSTLKTLFWQIPSGILWWPPMLQSLHNEKSLSGPKINKNVVQMLVQLKKRHSVGLIATFSSRVCILQRMYKNSLITERQQSSCYLALTSVPNLVCIYWATTDIVFILFDLIPTVEVWILLKCCVWILLPPLCPALYELEAVPHVIPKSTLGCPVTCVSWN